MDIIQDEQVNLNAIVARCDTMKASSLVRPFDGIKPNLNESLTLAKAGALLMPLRPMVFDQAGRFICTCSKGKACGATGKHPMLVGGLTRRPVIQSRWKNGGCGVVPAKKSA